MHRLRLGWSFSVLALMAFTLGTSANRMRAQQAEAAPDAALQAPKVIAPLYVVTFIDLMPPGAVAGTNATKQYVTDTRKESGIVRAELIAQVGGRANHIVVIEVWKDQAAFEKHESAAHTIRFRTTMQPLLGAPFDQRLHFLLE